MKYFITGLTFVFFIIGINATTLYVVSPVAKLLDEPNMSAKGKPLAKGSSLKQVGEKGMFFKVRTDQNKTGWVSKIFVSKNSPLKSKVSFGENIEKTTTQKARMRASDYSQTASARGSTKSESVRTRGAKSDYDLESLEWLEKQEVNDQELEKFLKQKE
ncbi:MAG: hypothetical protein H7A23_22075 [Leptospiraceae bacterium]|nr:hypothetical protein [Leptospiraceae bacterium]MCP5497249.1 hypothetical protein [Leptospiraceae bacterium]